ncbi:hypothetical protein [Clostridium sp. BL-8]|nr:hypothetical protein [Clostridium sp. BL-8]
MGMRTILTGHLLEKERKDYDAIKNFADFYIIDFREIVDIIRN